MTLIHQVKSLIRHTLEIKTEDMMQPNDATIARIASAIHSIAKSLTIPSDLIPSMLYLAHRQLPRYEMPCDDALLYAFLLCVFTLYTFSDKSLHQLLLCFDEDLSLMD